jgi:hypothetical protein
MTEDDLARFTSMTGLALPKAMMKIPAKPPWLETDVDKLVALNTMVHAPGTPWIGKDGPWPEDHVVIGEDGCGNYWSVLRPDKDAADSDSAVWFYDHDFGIQTETSPTLGAFWLYLEVTHPIEKFDFGEWRVIAQQSVGPIKFRMSREEVRTVLAQPYTAFRKTPFSEELTDAFDTLDIHVYYREGGVEAVEFANAAKVKVGGSLLGTKSFAEMEAILWDPVVPNIATPTSLQSRSFGVDFSIATADDRDRVGAIQHILVAGPGYFERQAEELAKLAG